MYKLHWHDKSGNRHQKTFSTLRQMLGYAKKNCGLFYDLLRFSRWDGKCWERIIVYNGYCMSRPLLRSLLVKAELD